MMTMTRRIRPSDSRKTSSSESSTINVVTVEKGVTVTATTPSNSSDRPHSRRLPAKQATPSRYIENPRQNMHTDTADIEAVVFAFICSEDQENYAATALTVLEEEIGERITALPATP